MFIFDIFNILFVVFFCLWVCFIFGIVYIIYNFRVLIVVLILNIKIIFVKVLIIFVFRYRFEIVLLEDLIFILKYFLYRLIWDYGIFLMVFILILFIVLL